MIISCSLSSPSLSSPPTSAQVGCCKNQAANEHITPPLLEQNPQSFPPPPLWATLSTGTPWVSDILGILWSPPSQHQQSPPQCHLFIWYLTYTVAHYFWVPVSQKLKTDSELLRASLAFSGLNPLEGMVFTNSLNCNLYETAVSPVQPRASITMCKDWKQNRLDRTEAGSRSGSSFPAANCTQIETCFS